MSRPTTLLIREPDEERTEVDSRFADRDPCSDVTLLLVGSGSSSSAAPPFEGSGRATARVRQPPNAGDSRQRQPASSLRVGVRTRISARWVLVAGLGTVLVTSLGFATIWQWRVARSLRAAIADMSMGVPARPRPDPIASSADPFGAPTTRNERQEPEEHGREELEHRGARLLGSNNFSDALLHYRRLVELFPEDAVFRDVVTVLRSKLGCAHPDLSSSPACRR